VHTGFVQVLPLQLHRSLHLHVLEEAAAELLVFRDGVLTAVFIRVSVTEVGMIRMRPTVA
jgi:hypothetical protein